jgi:hypothetical protein
MSASAVFTGVIGVAASFAPHEILAAAGVDPAPVTVMLAQVLGAIYLAAAMQNWMSRGNTIGGIYSRPLVVANVVHFAVVAIVLIKALAGGSSCPGLGAAAVAYSAFAAAFAFVMVTHPKQAG